jgi:hypothetical protein
MNSKLLYEAAFKFDGAVLFLPLSLAFCVLILLWCVRSFRRKEAAAVTRGSFLFGSVVMVVAIVALLIAFFEQARMYDGIVGAYKRGEYQTVEGEVRSFKVTDEQSESFFVGDVAFAYDYSDRHFGYHNEAGKENLITADTGRVRIGYVEYPRLGPVIVRIEKLPDEAANN